jgi:hypothetical protein
MADFTSVRVGELPPAIFSPSDLIPHEIGGLLKSGTLTDMATAISLIIGATAGVGFRAVQVSDGDTLPTTTQQEFILVGRGTYFNVGGGATVVANEGLNVLVSNGTNWNLGVTIPIITPELVVKNYSQLILRTANPQNYSLPDNTQVQILHKNGGFLYPNFWVQNGNVLTINDAFDPNGLDEIVITGIQQETQNTQPFTDVLLNQVIMLQVPTSFISSNFELSGLGVGAFTKYAICNGNNGTEDFGGRTPIGFDPVSYPNLGFKLGSKDAVVVAHSHNYTQYELDQEVSSSGSGVRSLQKNNQQVGSFTTSTVGISGVDKNMQPSIVVLFIKKITS